MLSARALWISIAGTTALLLSTAASADSYIFYANHQVASDCSADLSIQAATKLGAGPPVGSKVTSVVFKPFETDSSTLSCDSGGGCSSGEYEVDSIFVGHNGKTVAINGTSHDFDGMDASGTWFSGGYDANYNAADIAWGCGALLSLNWNFTVNYTLPTPSVTLVTPNTGTTAGGTLVTFKGNSFTSATSIYFEACGSAAAAGSLKFVDAQTMTGVTPPMCPGTANLQAENANGAQNPVGLYTYGAYVPTVTSIGPTRGPMAGGTKVTLAGYNLDPTSTVSFGGAPAQVTWVSANKLLVLTPKHAAGAVDVKVTAWGQSGTVPSGFVYQMPVARLMSVLDFLLK